MSHEPSSIASGSAIEAWHLVRALAARAEAMDAAGVRQGFVAAADGTLAPVPAGGPHAAVTWEPGRGWTLAPEAAAAMPLADLYLPVCSATARAPITLGHMGQSLDGFIATHTGDSQFVTGEENLRHMHRLRAICDAVIVGAGTVAADDPRLTTRHVAGPNPLRVVIDPMARLVANYRVFQDAEAPTLYVYVRRYVSGVPPVPGHVETLAVGDGPHGPDLAELVAMLRSRGCARLFVEGGGVTVSAFLAAGLLDRVQVAVAPMFIGGGRPAFRLPAANLLRDVARPAYRVFRMGGDVLFDCDLRGAAGDAHAGDTISRVI